MKNWHEESWELMETADRIKILRILNGFNQLAIAAMLGAPRPSIAVWESGKHPPAQQYVIRFAEKIGVEPGYILFGRPQISCAAWIPTSPDRPQNYAPLLKDISLLFPQILQENEIDSVGYSRLGDGGTVYLLGRKWKFSILLLVRESLVSCFDKILVKGDTIKLLPFITTTIDTFSLSDLSFPKSREFSIDIRSISQALSRARREKYTLSSIMTAFCLALQEFEPLELEDLAKFSVFFEKTANNNIPLSDINPIAMTREAREFLISINCKKRTATS